jgi:hypothetical protein
MENENESPDRELRGPRGAQTLAAKAREVAQCFAAAQSENPSATARDAEALPAPVEYRPTPQEQRVLEQNRKRRGEKVAPSVVLEFDGYKKLSPKPAHPDAAIGWELLAQSLGCSDPEFVRELVGRLPLASWGPNTAAHELNFIISFMQSVTPRDELETMLAAQMAVVPRAMMGSAEAFMTKNALEERQFYAAACTKFARTFAQQSETLRRLRTGGEQKIAIQNNNVSVEVTHTNAVAKEGIEVRMAAPLALTDSQQLPMVDEPARAVVPARKSAEGKLNGG